ncbi:MAG: YkgJ family cysteine cluster protein [Bacteroidota bacterium]
MTSSLTEHSPLPETYTALLKKALKQAQENKKFLGLLKKKPPHKLDDTVHTLHEQAFSTIDCLACANCCKTTSPIFYTRDIERIAKHFRIKPSQFIDDYLRIDEDQDYVLKSSPCIFLGTDNYCNIYEHRPTACREYPHTNRKKVHQLLDLTYRNTFVCPAVVKIVEALKQHK